MVRFLAVFLGTSWAAPASLLGGTPVVGFWLDQTPAARAAVCEEGGGHWQHETGACVLGAAWGVAEVQASSQALRLTIAGPDPSFVAFREEAGRSWTEARGRLGYPDALRVKCAKGASDPLVFFQSKGCGLPGSTLHAHWSDVPVEGSATAPVDLSISISEDAAALALVRGAPVLVEREVGVSFGRVRTVGAVSPTEVSLYLAKSRAPFVACLEKHHTTPAGAFRVKVMAQIPGDTMDLHVLPVHDVGLAECFRAILPAIPSNGGSVVMFDVNIDVQRSFAPIGP